MEKNWWKEAIVYQIYPRSFNDSNGDGIGDIKGVISKLTYLKELGIDVIWLSPHYASPNTDNGYDIADYEGIMAEFGSMADFDEMLAEIHRLGLKLIIDLVVNHSSDEHRWFQESRKSTDNPYRNYYIWKKDIPNDWVSFFSGPAWTKDEITNEYYLHLFAKKQPDLNWDNPTLRQEIYKMMHFWLRKGVDGFRMDVISVISKEPSFNNFPEGRFGDLYYYANGPRVHEFLQEMNQEVLSKYDCMTVGEAFGVQANEALQYVGKNQNELQMIYHFDHAVPREEACFAEPKPEFTLVQLKGIFNKWDKTLANDGWNTIYFGNHDNPRMVSRFGDAERYHYESATMLATILLTQRGTPYLYQGDEIGMTNCIFTHLDLYNDVQVLNAYDALVKTEKCSESQFLQACNTIARDHARTPMQWNGGLHAGFSNGQKTWLMVNPNYKDINVENQQKSEQSVLKYYQKMIQLRKQHNTLVYGKYDDLLPNDTNLWVYTRSLSGTTFLIICNFSKNSQQVPQFAYKQLLMSNYNTNDRHILKPFEVRICEI